MDGRARSVMLETAVMAIFVAAALWALDRSHWIIAIILAAHAAWDRLHTQIGITKYINWWAPFCAAFDLTAAAVFIDASAADLVG